MQNTIVYIILLLISGFLVYRSKFSLPMKISLFFIMYYLLFFTCEIVDIFTPIPVWNQGERTSACYDWFQHYLKKDYGNINGKHAFDYSENLYFNNYNISSEKALENKYNYMFNELNLSEGKRLLDCGCGIGTWMQFCKNKGVNVVGLTLSKEQQLVCQKRGLTVYVQDYRVLNKDFINKFDAISLLGSTEHVSIFSDYKKMVDKSYHDYKSLFSVLKQYVNGKILLTTLVQCTPSSKWNLYDFIQCHILQRHYGGYYSKTELISKAITENGLRLDSVTDHTKDYHWISVAEPDHFGHWWIHWEENPIDKILYFFKGLVTDPFLLHHWLYYGLDSWMYHLGGYQKTPLTDEQVNNALCNLKYFSISN